MNEKTQLKMNWPAERLSRPPDVLIPAGYELRTAEPNDEQPFLQLMRRCGWDFGPDKLEYCCSRMLPDGWFLIVHSASGDLAASAMSLHNYSGHSPYSGTLGWVGCDPIHRGRKLGSAVAAAVTRRLIEGGYRDIELYTEHHREAAIISYFRLGYIPYLYGDAVTQLWREVCRRIELPFTPEIWPSGDNAYPKS